MIHECFEQEHVEQSTSLPPVCLRCVAAQKTAMVWVYVCVCVCVCVCARAWVGTWVYELCSSLHEMTGLVVVFFVFLRFLNAITVLLVILLFLGFWDIPLRVVIHYGLRLMNLQLKQKIRVTKIIVNKYIYIKILCVYDVHNIHIFCYFVKIFTVSWSPNQHIRTICHVKLKSNDWWKIGFHHRKILILKYIKMEKLF